MAAESTLLTANREELVKNIRFVEPFLDRLIQKNQLTTEECEEVRSGRTPQDRARALIDLVSTKGQEAFGHFRHALKETNPELANILYRCTDHNEKIRLHCDDCVQLLCRTCNKEGHGGHRVSSIVADASAIRREVTAFFRDNRKMLKSFDASVGDVGGRENVLLDIELRKNALKAMFMAKIELEYEWCKDQLGLDERAASPAASISSVATSNTESELSDRHGTRSPGAKRLRGVIMRNHPYSRGDQNSSRGTQPRSPSLVHSPGLLHGLHRMPIDLKGTIQDLLPPSTTPPSLTFSPSTSLSPSQSLSQDTLPTSSSPRQSLYSSPPIISPGVPFSNYSPSASNTPTSRSTLSPISFSHDTNSPAQELRHSPSSSNSERESFSQPSPPSNLTPDSPSLGFPSFPIESSPPSSPFAQSNPLVSSFPSSSPSSNLVTPGPSFPPSSKIYNSLLLLHVCREVAQRVIQELCKEVAQRVKQEVCKEIAQRVKQEVCKEEAQRVRQEVCKEVAQRVIQEMCREVAQRVIQDTRIVRSSTEGDTRSVYGSSTDGNTRSERRNRKERQRKKIVGNCRGKTSTQ